MYACGIFARKIFFPAIFGFQFHENPRFRDEFQALGRMLMENSATLKVILAAVFLLMVSLLYMLYELFQASINK